MPEDPPMDRRRFFRRGIAELFKPIANAISPLERMAKHIGQLDGQGGKEIRGTQPAAWLRPPLAQSVKAKGSQRRAASPNAPEC